MKNKTFYLSLGLPIILLVSLLIFSRYGRPNESKWKKINIPYGEMIEIPELVTKKEAKIQDISFLVTNDQILWGIANSETEKHYFEYGSIDLNLENPVSTDKYDYKDQGARFVTDVENSGLSNTILNIYLVERPIIEKYITSELEEVTLSYKQLKHEGLKTNFELSDNRLLHLIKDADYMTKEENQILILSQIVDGEAKGIKEIEVADYFENQSEKITSISVNEKNIYVTTTDKTIRIYNHTLDLEKKVDLSTYVSDEFTSFIKLKYIEQIDKNIVQISPTKFCWLDNEGNLKEWEEKNISEISENIVVFEMKRSFFYQEESIKNTRYLLDWKQEKIVDTINYGSSKNEKTKKRFSYTAFQTDARGNLYFRASIENGKQLFDYVVTSKINMPYRKFIVKIKNEHILDFLNELNEN